MTIRTSTDSLLLPRSLKATVGKLSKRDGGAPPRPGDAVPTKSG